MKKGRKKQKKQKNKATKKLYQLSICKGGGHFVPFFSLFYLCKIIISFFICQTYNMNLAYNFRVTGLGGGGVNLTIKYGGGGIFVLFFSQFWVN